MVIPEPLLHPSLTPNPLSIEPFKPLVLYSFFFGIKYYFLNNPIFRFEYIKILLLWFPQDIIDQYNIMNLVDKDSFVYVDIHNGVYSPKQEACIDVASLVKLLNTHGYCPLFSNSEIWCHETLPTKFSLCMDYLGIKYTNPARDHHLVNILQK